MVRHSHVCKQGAMPLCLAASRGLLEASRCLLQRDADVHVRDDAVSTTQLAQFAQSAIIRSKNLMQAMIAG